MSKQVYNFDSRSLRSAAFFAVLVLAGCGGSSDKTSATTPGSTSTSKAAAGVPQRITVLGASKSDGPYGHALALKLVDSPEPIPFYVCAAWGSTAAPADCHAAADAKLPLDTELRLEQHPAGPAVPVRGNPGWGTVGSSDTPELSVPLSNGVTGNKVGKVTFRATLRNRSGRILASSDTFSLTWHN